jgi:hypothetical protein
MSEQQPTTSAQDQPAPDGFTSWPEYWTAQGMPWRTEPEIDLVRQQYVSERRSIVPNIEVGVFPFKDMKVERKDVEWLLSTLDSGGVRGPVDANDPAQSERDGVDVRGAHLRGSDLRNLPLARLQAAGTDLREAHLEGATLVNADLERADLREAFLDASTRLDGLLLGDQRGDTWTQVVKSKERQRHFVSAAMWIIFRQVFRVVGSLAGVVTAIFVGLALVQELSTGEILVSSLINGGWVTLIIGFNVVLALSAFVSAALGFLRARAARRATGARLEGVHWGGANLAVLDWQQVRYLGDELVARQPRDTAGKKKSYIQRVEEYQAAARAYRQMAVELSARGLRSDADAFTYRALLMERRVSLRQLSVGRWLGSAVLDAVSGYGFRPTRSFITYALVILGFAAVYLSLGGAHGQVLSWNESIVISMTAFHGRGFFQTSFQVGDPQAAVAAVEALLGLLVEIVLIATFTQRFFAR